jgi:hypothetical protein
MESFITIILVFLIGFLVGEIVTTINFSLRIQKIIKDTQILKEELDKKEITFNLFELETEQIEDQIYLYTRDTKDFICQGQTLEELAKLSKEYKNIKHAEVRHENKFFIFNDGKLEQLYK